MRRSCRRVDQCADAAPGLRVASLTSSFRFKGLNFDIRDAGARLNVESLLEGSLRRSAGRLRVVVKLVDTATEYPMWSETYESPVTDIFEIQDAVAVAVSLKLQASLLVSRPSPTR